MSNNDKTLMKPSAKDCLNVANSLIVRCNLSVSQLNDVAEINSSLIVLLYEKITGSSVPDLISCETQVEEASNVQAVINALSLDILQLSLSHISGEAVVSGDVVNIYNLLHVLKAILLHSSGRGEEEQTFLERKVVGTRLKKRVTQISKETFYKQATSASPMGIEKIFEKNAELKLQTTLIKNSHSLKSKPFLKEKNDFQHTMQPLRKSTHPSPCRKSYLLPYALRKKHSSRPALKNVSTKKHELPQKEEGMHEARREMKRQTNFVQELLEEFPGIQISHSLKKNIENMYAQQLIRMHKLMKRCLLEKSKPAVETEDIFKRQLKLAEMLKKDMLQQQLLMKTKEEKENERKIKYCLRNARLKSAKMKQYSEEFSVEMRKKMMKAGKIEEELILKRVFNEVMDIQSEHVNELCQQVRQATVKDDELYLNYLNSLENLYHSQYLALSEKIANEKSDAQLRLNAERQALLRTEREFRESLKNEIRFMQRVIVEQTEDCHFREVDANFYIDEKRRQPL